MSSRTDQSESGETSQRFEFSVPRHIEFLAGYMDAVGRFKTTDAELWALTARGLKSDESPDLVLRGAIRAQTSVEKWGREFDSLARDFLGVDPCSRLGFYLVDYICWFKEFTQDAECLKLDCDPLSRGTIGQSVYLLRLEGDHRVLLLLQHIDKARRESVNDE